MTNEGFQIGVVATVGDKSEQHGVHYKWKAEHVSSVPLAAPSAVMCRFCQQN